MQRKTEPEIIQNSGLSLCKSVVWNTAASIFYLFCNWLTTFLVVRLGGDYSASGVLSMAMSVGNVISAIALFRIRPVQVSDYGEDSAKYLSAHILAALIAVAFGIVYIPFSTSYESISAVIIYAIFKVCESLVDYFQGVDQKASRLDIAGISQIIRGLLLIVGFVLGLVVFGSLEISLLFMLATTVIVILIFDIPNAYHLASVSLSGAWLDGIRVLIQCFPGFVASLMCTVAVSYVRQRYGIVYGSNALGIYAAIAAPVTLVQAFASYVYAPYYGLIANLVSKKENNKILMIVAKAFAFLVIMVFIGFIAINAMGERMISLIFGAGLSGYFGLLYTMLLSTALTAGQLFLVDFFVIAGQKSASVISSAVVLISAITLSHIVLGFDQNTVSQILCISFGLGNISSFLFLRQEYFPGD